MSDDPEKLPKKIVNQAQVLRRARLQRLNLKADEAIDDRRNAAVEQERAIKENELNTEAAVEHKKRVIREAANEA